MKALFTLGLAIGLALQASAQMPSGKPPEVGLEPGQNLVGGVVGFGNLGQATAAIGGRFEHAASVLPSLANGVLGFAFDADWYTYSDPAFGPGASFTYIPIGASANYHFRLNNRQWDPFLGVGVGYSIASVSGNGQTATASSTIYLITRAGVRYFYSPKLAFQADAGAGAAALNVGLVFRM